MQTEPTDFSQVGPEVREAVKRVNDRMMLAILSGMAHETLAHNAQVVMQADSLCEDSVVVLCGSAVFARIQQMQQEAREIYAEGLTAVTVKKAMGAND